MEITSFINSNDIREYLEKINYKFTPLEAAWLVYQCKLISIPEKQEAFKEIIRTMPDCEVKNRFNTVPQKSLHEFLGKYISLQNKFIDTFFNDKDSVYRLIYIDFPMRRAPSTSNAVCPSDSFFHSSNLSYIFLLYISSPQITKFYFRLQLQIRIFYIFIIPQIRKLSSI